MTRSDQTGKFNGFTKKTCWETLVQSTDDILDLLIQLWTTDMNMALYLSHQNPLLFAFTTETKYHLVWQTYQDLHDIAFPRIS